MNTERGREKSACRLQKKGDNEYNGKQYSAFYIVFFSQFINIIHISHP